jgi:hypothetical protein
VEPVKDEVFLRRIYLDVCGRVPTGEEIQAFTVSKSRSKRAEWIDRLLNSPGYNSQMFSWVADMMRVRDDYSRLSSESKGKYNVSYLYQEWLKLQVAENVPWDRWVSQMLVAEGSLADTGAVGYLAREYLAPMDRCASLLSTFL